MNNNNNYNNCVIIDFMDTASRLAVENISGLLENQKVYYTMHNSPPKVSDLAGKLSPDTPYLLKVNLSVIHSSPYR
jgi:hypothetical protein